MEPYLWILIGVALVVGLFQILQSFRVKAMRALASKRGFEYTGRSLPTSFSMTCYPFNSNPSVWNVIEGQQNGVSILIFDSVVGRGRSRYRTFIPSIRKIVPSQRMKCSSAIPFNRTDGPRYSGAG